MAPVTYLEAIRKALWEEMERDPAVFCLGEDIGVYGGAFKVTEGFIHRFGPERIIDTPIAESAIVGSAFGAALAGMRPVVEFQFMDFIGCAFNQITNMVAKSHYRWGAPAPIVIRGPSGGGVHGGPFHSQNPEMYFVHTPGLKVVCPGTPADAYGLIKSAIRDNNPVIFFEHKALYRRIKEELPADIDFTVPIGKARTAREGRDVSIITYSAMVLVAQEAAEILVKEGIELEIVDLRTLLPLDRDAIAHTVRKTNRVIILHEDTMTGGIAGEISAIINEEVFDDLDGPIMRITAIDSPVPFSPPLEHSFLPSVADVVQKARLLKKQSESVTKMLATENRIALESGTSATSSVPPDDFSDSIIPMSPVDRDRARRWLESERISPHVYMGDEINLERVIANLRRLSGDSINGGNPTSAALMPFLVLALCDAIRSFPVLNASVEGNNIRYHAEINLAIENADSLSPPSVIRNAETKSIDEVQQILGRRSPGKGEHQQYDRPRENLNLTFTILNSCPGAVVNLPLVRQPQVAILAIGSVRKKPVVTEGNDSTEGLSIAQTLPIVLGHDHRIIDGAIAARFLTAFKHRLENWS
jgi:2-oxoisovalerate dehydrogenase E1 component beta subunit